MPLPFPYSNKKAGSKASRVMGISTAYRQMPVMPTDFNKRPNRKRATNFTGQWKTGRYLALPCEKRARDVGLARHQGNQSAPADTDRSSHSSRLNRRSSPAQSTVRLMGDFAVVSASITTWGQMTCIKQAKVEDKRHSEMSQSTGN